jgi:hypothetical protein
MPRLGLVGGGVCARLSGSVHGGSVCCYKKLLLRLLL